MSSPSSSGTPVAIAVSIAGHLVFAVVASVAAREVVVPLGEETSVEVTIEEEPRDEIVEPPEPVVAPEEPAPVAAAAEPPPRRTERPRTVRDPIVREEPEPVIDPPTMYEVEVDARALVRDSRSDSAIVFDAQPTEPRDVGPARGRHGRARRPSGEELGERLGRSLAQEVNARDYVTERPPPELRARADGGYSFSGHVFDAVIRPDGEVEFEDRPPVSVEGFGQFGFDVTDALQRGAGNDPYRAEREWFMNETEEIRDRLASRASQRVSREALTGLEDRLRRVWTSDRSVRDRKRALFDMWDECAEDETGAEARNRIVAFIRREIAEGSTDEYGTDELARLNRDRTSRARFDPYR
jgi:hypothetical protein